MSSIGVTIGGDKPAEVRVLKTCWGPFVAVFAEDVSISLPSADYAKALGLALLQASCEIAAAASPTAAALDTSESVDRCAVVSTL